MRGCGQEVAIVRVDFGEAIFTGANQVQRIGGTQIDRRGKLPVGARDLFEQVRGKREQFPVALLHVAVKLCVENGRLIRSQRTFSQLAVENGVHFGQRQRTDCDLAGVDRAGANLSLARFVEVELGDVSGIELDHVRSRSSEMICVLSVPPTGRCMMAANSGLGCQFLNDGFFGDSSSGTSFATDLPLSVTRISPYSAA